MNYKVNSQHKVAVATDYYWIPVDSDTPRGVKLQLLTKGGIATYGQWAGTADWITHWAPLPKKPE